MNGLSDTQKINILWKKFIAGKSYTADELSFDEESIKSKNNNIFKNVWIDDIPDTNPLSDHSLYSNLQEYPFDDSQKTLKKYHKVVLEPARGNNSNKAFKSNIDDIVPSEYGDGKYQWQLWKKDTSGEYTLPVPYGLKGWYFDKDSGVLFFPNGFPDGINNTNLKPAMTFYKYIGRKGSSSLLGGGTGGDNVQVDNESIEVSVGKLAIKGKYKTVGYYANTLNSNANLSSNTFVITHNLNTKYVTISVYENSGLKRKVHFQETLTSNIAVTLSSSSNVRAGDYQVTIIGIL